MDRVVVVLAFYRSAGSLPRRSFPWWVPSSTVFEGCGMPSFTVHSIRKYVLCLFAVFGGRELIASRSAGSGWLVLGLGFV